MEKQIARNETRRRHACAAGRPASMGAGKQQANSCRRCACKQQFRTCMPADRQQQAAIPNGVQQQAANNHSPSLYLHRQACRRYARRQPTTKQQGCNRQQQAAGRPHLVSTGALVPTAITVTAAASVPSSSTYSHRKNRKAAGWQAAGLTCFLAGRPFQQSQQSRRRPPFQIHPPAVQRGGAARCCRAGTQRPTARFSWP